MCDIYATLNAAVEFETQRQTKGVRRAIIIKQKDLCCKPCFVIIYSNIHAYKQSKKGKQTWLILINTNRCR